ncbi:DUF5518 domain-containing protein [Halalkalicoccus ordinarius]|uniref:DUF5518 domain-containing protein n=1 Tax=Halalkalicoccus ordinarius TaxID=3116651 RepID=UPI00300F3F82
MAYSNSTNPGRIGGEPGVITTSPLPPSVSSARTQADRVHTVVCANPLLAVACARLLVFRLLSHYLVRWSAVITEFVVGLLISVLGLALPVIGQIGGGLIGGFIAGWLATGGVANGAWHGLLAGALGGILLAGFIVISTTVLGVTGVIDPVTGLLGGSGLAAAVLFFAILLAIGGVLRS